MVLRRLATALAAATALALTLERTSAFNYVIDINGTYWGIQDDDSPRVDTGSIRATQVAPGGQSGAFSTSINGFGGHQGAGADHTGAVSQRRADARLRPDVRRRQPVQHDAVASTWAASSSRAPSTSTPAPTGDAGSTPSPTRRRRPLTIKVAFGGQSGIGTTGGNSSAIVTTSSGDALVTPADAWVEYAHAALGHDPGRRAAGDRHRHRRARSRGAMTFAGNWLDDTFTTPLAYSGHERNFQAYVNTLTLPPGRSQSLLHFVVLGQRVNAATSAAERAAVEATASSLATTPAIGDLTTAEICSIANFDIAAMSISRLRLRLLRAARSMAVVAQPPVPQPKKGKTAVKYDVVEKTIGQLRPTWRPASSPRRRSRARISTASSTTTRASSDSMPTRSSPRMPSRRPRPPTRRAGTARHGTAARHSHRRQEQLRHVRHGRPRTAASPSRTSTRRATPSRWRGCARPAR